MNLTIEYDREEDGRWIADIPELPGVLVYGDTKEEANIKVKALALWRIHDMLVNERPPSIDAVIFKEAS